jgi:hypothetical protein
VTETTGLSDNEDDPAQIPGDLQMALRHLISEGNYDSASLPCYYARVSNNPLAYSSRGRIEPSLLTMYRPKAPVAPNTVAVCPAVDIREGIPL